MILRFIILTNLLFFSITAYASDSQSILDDVDTEKTVMQNVQDDGDSISKSEYRRIQEVHRFYLIAAMIAVTPVFLLILLFFIRKSKDYNEHAILHSSGLVLVIQATVIVVIASPTTEQLTAAIGVLAAIAGYLFGSAKRSKAEE